MSIFATGYRLLNERNRLGITQEQMATLGKISKRMYVKYEHGIASPKTEYLEEIAKHGANIAYVVIGDSKEIEITPLIERLIKERKRLNISAQVMADSGNIPLHVYLRYELNQAPMKAAFLENIRSLGIDIYYILTGERSNESDQ